MSIFKEMEEFRALSKTVKVELKEHGVILEFERCTPEELSFVYRSATGNATDLEKGELDRGKFGMSLDREMWLMVKKKLVNWEAIEGHEVPEFSKPEADLFLKCAPFTLQQEITMAYSTLTRREKEEAEKNADTSVKVSSKRSKSA